MNGAFYIGAIGMSAQQQALDVVANNIANINTVGFKRSTVRFSELLSSVARPDAVARPGDLRDVGLSGVTIASTTRVWTPGDLRQTGQPLDLAIDGDGFLEVLGPAGRTMLWRGGTLKIDTDGYLAAADGTILKGLISVPVGASKLSISADGTVIATVDGESRQLGQLDLVQVKDPDALTEIGSGYFEVADASETMTAKAGEDGAGRFVQGALESANVQLTDEMMSLLLLQRAYAANAQVAQAGDQLLAIANGLRR